MGPKPEDPVEEPGDGTTHNDVTEEEILSNPEAEPKDPVEEPGDGTTDNEQEPETPAQSNKGNIAADVGKITAIVEGANMVEGATMEEE